MQSTYSSEQYGPGKTAEMAEIVEKAENVK